MSLVRWEPKRARLDPFRSLRDEVDRLFDDFAKGWPRPWVSGNLTAADVFMPSVNLRETDGEYVITADVPGFPRDRIEVTLAADGLTIRGERREEKESAETGYHLRESATGSFHRVIPLPTDVVAEKAQARLADGVLTVTLPKAEPRSPTRVTISVN